MPKKGAKTMKRNVPYWLPLAALAAILVGGIFLPIWAASTDDNAAKHVRAALVDTAGDRISPAAAGEAASAATTVASAVAAQGTGQLAKETGGNLATLAGTVTSAQVAVKVDSTQATALTPPTAAAIATAVANPDSLTFTRVKIDQTTGAGQKVLIAADGTKVMRLHRLYVRMAVAGDLTIEEAAGTDLTGPMPVAATGIVDLKFDPSKAGGHVATSAGAGLAILTTQKVYGFAIVSSAAN
jgi:hypothetical protein